MAAAPGIACSPPDQLKQTGATPSATSRTAVAGGDTGSAASKREQRHERELSERFELAYKRLVEDWQPRRSGAGATPGLAS